MQELGPEPLHFQYLRLFRKETDSFLTIKLRLPATVCIIYELLKFCYPEWELLEMSEAVEEHWHS